MEIIQIVAAGMSAGMRVEQLAGLELAYPTFTAIVGLAARRIMGEIGASTSGGQDIARRPGSVEWEWRAI